MKTKTNLQIAATITTVIALVTAVIIYSGSMNISSSTQRMKFAQDPCSKVYLECI